MKTLVLLVALMSVSAMASEVNLRCTDSSIEKCTARVAAEISAQQCVLANETIRCEKLESGILCSAETEKCSDASSDGFVGVTCSQGTKVDIKDKKLTATWARSVLWLWVKSICKSN
ncbi:MAG: hypothetical protein AB7I27_03460 [Bacteriovoracaceae bacterium]